MVPFVGIIALMTHVLYGGFVTLYHSLVSHVSVPCFADSVCVLITIIYTWRDLLAS